MTTHLPECPVADFTKQQYVCICFNLRACEQRKDAEWQRKVDYVRDEWSAIARKRFAAGVQAARDAVAAVEVDGGWAIEREAALAAIDALKGDTHG